MPFAHLNYIPMANYIPIIFMDSCRGEGYVDCEVKTNAV